MQYGNNVYAKLYLFGSCLVRDDFNDIDILLIYNDQQIRAEDAYRFFKPMLIKAQIDLNHPIHPMLLSEEEERIMGYTKCESMTFVSEIYFEDDIGGKIQTFVTQKFPNRLSKKPSLLCK